MLETDPDLLKTILRNLVDNAIKYSNADSTILVEANGESGTTSIMVKDFGKGMNQEQINNLFKMYKGKSTSGTHGEGGSGLGLNLVHELVERTGGKIKANSKLGKGTEFGIIVLIKSHAAKGNVISNLEPSFTSLNTSMTTLLIFTNSCAMCNPNPVPFSPLVPLFDLSLVSKNI